LNLILQNCSRGLVYNENVGIKDTVSVVLEGRCKRQWSGTARTETFVL